MSGMPERLIFDTPATEAGPGLSPERVPLVVTGHVDHGKSTLVGRLLADTGSLPDGKLEAVRRTCARQGKRFEHAFLLDALKDEQAQGITIDTARVFFRTHADITSSSTRQATWSSSRTWSRARAAPTPLSS